MQAFWGHLLRFLPKNMISFFVGHLVAIKLPEPFGPWSVKWFCQRYRIRISEAEKELQEYKCIADLFTRQLRPDIRPIGEGFVHPVDGKLTVFGTIREGELIQAKGKKYSLEAFLSDKKALANFDEGQFLTYYLCPTDYHRVHSPVEGLIMSIGYLPGRLWPVNPWSVDNLSQLFSMNERVVINIKTTSGLVALVMVGATNVGKMTLSFDEALVTNNSHFRKGFSKKYAKAIDVKKGDELGVFNMGSTVIMVLPKNYLPRLPPAGNYPIKMGESFSELVCF